jgi:hypothetical protein
LLRSRQHFISSLVDTEGSLGRDAAKCPDHLDDGTNWQRPAVRHDVGRSVSASQLSSNAV